MADYNKQCITKNDVHKWEQDKNPEYYYCTKCKTKRMRIYPLEN